MSYSFSLGQSEGESWNLELAGRVGSWEERLSLAFPLVSMCVVFYRSKAGEAGEAEKKTVTTILQGEETEAQRG